ncbi:hypothetical protein [Planococcus sp. MB-3u-03]|uniref:hypothetical protein n=1 Tax=Planococcus sp. MB-3u-03 TaxID=2058136 RepID=UPI003FA75404
MHARRHKNFQYENDLLQYIQEVLQLLAGKSSPVERDLYIKQLSAETNSRKKPYCSSTGA